MNQKDDSTGLEFLKESLAQVNYWLQFAEAKNGGLIALIVAAIAIIFSMGFDGAIVVNMVKIIEIVLLSISLVIALTSMYPLYEKDISKKKKKDTETLNYLFYRDIADCTVEEYLNGIEKWIGKADNDMLKHKYAEEIVTNARIATAKYEYFKKALLIFIFAVVILPILAIVIA